MRTHGASFALNTNCPGKFAGLKRISPPAEGHQTLQDLRGVLGFVEIDSQKDIVWR